jgi:hypothetical protein
MSTDRARPLATAPLDDGWRRLVARPPTTALRRARHRLRTRVCEHPRLYLPFARRKYPGPSPEVLSAETELVIDGYTRCGSTFAVYGFQLAQDRPVRLAHHLHAPAQVVAAVRKGIPTLVVIREPEGAVLSQVIREPDVALPDALYAYARFYECLMPRRHGVVVADFEEVTHSFGSVIRRINARFGTSFREFDHTEANTAECFRLIKQRGRLSRTLLGFESGLVGVAEARREQQALARGTTVLHAGEEWVPSPARERSKGALRERWLAPDLAGGRDRADRAYRAFLGR